MEEKLSAVEKAFIDQSSRSLLQTVIKIAGLTATSVAVRHQLKRATDSYLTTYVLRHGQVKALMMPRPVPLYEIYTDVEVVSPRFLTRQLSVDEMQEAFRQGHRSLFAGERRESGMMIADRTQYLNVLGAPGAGKSTFLKRIGLEALLPRALWRSPILPGPLTYPARTFSHAVLPVFIELRQFRWTATADLKSTIVSEFEACGFPESAKFVDRGLKKGRFLLLFDGIDEVPTDKLDDLLSELRNIVSRYPRNRFITSCRTAYYKTFLANFVDVVVADLSDEAIAVFLEHWFSKDEDRQLRTAQHVWRELQADAATLELARTPLLLTFICLSYDETQRLPRHRSALYRQALQILTEKWAAEKRIYANSSLRQLSAETEIELLSDLAGPSFARDQLFFRRDEIISSFRRFITSHADPPPLGPDALLTAIEVEQGLFVGRGGEVYSFSHLSIQEFLAAHHYMDEVRYRDLIPLATFDDRWHEVFLLLSGVVKGDDFVRRVRENVSKQVFRNDFIRDLISFVGRRSALTTHSGTLTGRMLRLAAVIALWSCLRLRRSPSERSSAALRNATAPIMDRLVYLAHKIVKRGEGSTHTARMNASSHAILIEQLRGMVLTFEREYYPDLEVASRRAAQIVSSRVRDVFGFWSDLGLFGPAQPEQLLHLEEFGRRYTEWDDLIQILTGIIGAVRFYILSPSDANLQELGAYTYGTVLTWEVAHAAYRLSVDEWRRVNETAFRRPN